VCFFLCIGIGPIWVIYIVTCSLQTTFDKKIAITSYVHATYTVTMLQNTSREGVRRPFFRGWLSIQGKQLCRFVLYLYWLTVKTESIALQNNLGYIFFIFFTLLFESWWSHYGCYEHIFKVYISKSIHQLL